MQIKDTIALRKLAHRLNNPVVKINNSQLYAGSPMYFYCKMCGHQSDVKPESYTDIPKKHCNLCKELLDKNPNITPSSIVDMAKALPIEKVLNEGHSQGPKG